MKPLEPLEPELARLLDAERASTGPSTKDADGIYSHLSSTLGWNAPLPPSGGDGSGGAPTPGGGAGATGGAGALATSWAAKTAVIATLSFGAGGATGAGVHAALSRSPATPPPTVVVASPPPPPAIAPLASGESPRELPAVDAAAPEAPRVRPSRAPDAGTSLAQERSLLQGARMALLRDQPDAALSLLDQHDARFARGQLDEESQALRIELLLHAGRLDAARAAAARFRLAHPESLLLSGIEARLGGESDAGRSIP